MASDEIRKKEKKEKKDKKRKSEDIEDGAAEPTPKKSKKEKRKSEVALAEAQDDSVMDIDAKADDEKEKGGKAVIAVPLAALVPFANPLADEKAQKKVLKAVKKGKQNHDPDDHDLCGAISTNMRQQPPNTKLSSAASKNALSPSASHHPPHLQPLAPAPSPTAL